MKHIAALGLAVVLYLAAYTQTTAPTVHITQSGSKVSSAGMPLSDKDTKGNKSARLFGGPDMTPLETASFK